MITGAPTPVWGAVTWENTSSQTEVTVEIQYDGLSGSGVIELTGTPGSSSDASNLSLQVTSMISSPTSISTPVVQANTTTGLQSPSTDTRILSSPTSISTPLIQANTTTGLQSPSTDTRTLSISPTTSLGLSSGFGAHPHVSTKLLSAILLLACFV